VVSDVDLLSPIGQTGTGKADGENWPGGFEGGPVAEDNSISSAIHSANQLQVAIAAASHAL
jgi:hypothetical protein